MLVASISNDNNDVTCMPERPENENLASKIRKYVILCRNGFNSV